MVDLSKVQKMLRDYFDFDAQKKWAEEVKTRDVTSLEMISVQTELARLALNVLSDLVMLAHPDSEHHLGEETFQQYSSKVEDTLEMIYLTYLRQIFYESGWNVEKTIQQVMLMFSEMDVCRYKEKEEAIKTFKEATSSLLLGSAECLAEYIQAFNGIQATFKGTRCFDWVCGLDQPQNYYWLPEYAQHQKRKTNNPKGFSSIISTLRDEMMMNEGNSNVKH